MIKECQWLWKCELTYPWRYRIQPGKGVVKNEAKFHYQFWHQWQKGCWESSFPKWWTPRFFCHCKRETKIFQRLFHNSWLWWRKSKFWSPSTKQQGHNNLCRWPEVLVSDHWVGVQYYQLHAPFFVKDLAPDGSECSLSLLSKIPSKSFMGKQDSIAEYQVPRHARINSESRVLRMCPERSASGKTWKFNDSWLFNFRRDETEVLVRMKQQRKMEQRF